MVMRELGKCSIMQSMCYQNSRRGQRGLHSINQSEMSLLSLLKLLSDSHLAIIMQVLSWKT
jgi:hypothetical protein